MGDWVGLDLDISEPGFGGRVDTGGNNGHRKTVLGKKDSNSYFPLITIK